VQGNKPEERSKGGPRERHPAGMGSFRRADPRAVVRRSWEVPFPLVGARLGWGRRLPGATVRTARKWSGAQPFQGLVAMAPKCPEVGASLSVEEVSEPALNQDWPEPISAARALVWKGSHRPRDPLSRGKSFLERLPRWRRITAGSFSPTPGVRPKPLQPMS